MSNGGGVSTCTNFCELRSLVTCFCTGGCGQYKMGVAFIRLFYIPQERTSVACVVRTGPITGHVSPFRTRPLYYQLAGSAREEHVTEMYAK